MMNLFVTVQAWIATRHEGETEKGATMVEYGLLVALIAIVALVAVTALGVGISGVFQAAADALP